VRCRMNKEEVLKTLRRELDSVRISAKKARKRYDQQSERYYAGQEDSLMTAIYIIENMEEV